MSQSGDYSLAFSGPENNEYQEDTSTSCDSVAFFVMISNISFSTNKTLLFIDLQPFYCWLGNIEIIPGEELLSGYYLGTSENSTQSRSSGRR
jgi:hypothetical protein